jgi:hypothetical protein
MQSIASDTRPAIARGCALSSSDDKAPACIVALDPTGDQREGFRPRKHASKKGRMAPFLGALTVWFRMVDRNRCSDSELRHHFRSASPVVRSALPHPTPGPEVDPQRIVARYRSGTVADSHGLHCFPRRSKRERSNRGHSSRVNCSLLCLRLARLLFGRGQKGQ